MSIAPCFKEQTVVVLGLGRTGIHAALALKAGDAKVLAWDDTEPARILAKQKGIEVSNLNGLDWCYVSAVVLSPGIPHKHPKPHPVIANAVKAGVPLISDIDLLGRCYPKAHYIGITGTNGKTTTTSLIGHVLAHAQKPAYVAGNIGTSVFSFSVQDPESTFVLEMSSFQLELTESVCFDTAVLLNMTPDHLLRHGGVEGYQRAKKFIFAGQSSNDLAIVGIDTQLSREVYKELQVRSKQVLIPISATTVVPGGVYFKNGFLIDDTEGRKLSVIDMTTCRTLQGAHNGQNAAAAYIIAKREGISTAQITQAFQSFKSLPHRQEIIATHNVTIPLTQTLSSRSPIFPSPAGTGIENGVCRDPGAKARISTLDHGELDFALHTAKAVWAKSASEMTPAGRAEWLPHNTINNGVTYVNDSKATNVDATLQALARFDNIHWILGGQFKENSLEALYPYLNRVKHAYLIGQAAQQFEQWLKGKVPLTRSETLEQAVLSAASNANAEENSVVLLSPACASFDQFKDFEARGEAFRHCVQDLNILARTGND